MYESSMERRGLTASPIKFHTKDSIPTKLIKTLVSSMINFSPDDRPTIDEVLEELMTLSCEFELFVYESVFSLIQTQKIGVTGRLLTDVGPTRLPSRFSVWKTGMEWD